MFCFKYQINITVNMWWVVQCFFCLDKWTFHPKTFDNAVLFCTSKAMFQTDKNLWVLSIIIKRKLGTYLLFYCIFTDRAFVVRFKSLSCTWVLPVMWCCCCFFFSDWRVFQWNSCYITAAPNLLMCLWNCFPGCAFWFSIVFRAYIILRAFSFDLAIRESL